MDCLYNALLDHIVQKIHSRAGRKNLKTSTIRDYLTRSETGADYDSTKVAAHNLANDMNNQCIFVVGRWLATDAPLLALKFLLITVAKLKPSQI